MARLGYGEMRVTGVGSGGLRVARRVTRRCGRYDAFYI